MANFERLSTVLGPQEHCPRLLSSLTSLETQLVLRHLNMPGSVIEAFAKEQVDGRMLNCVDTVSDFTEIGLKNIHAKLLFRVVSDAKELGVPVDWLTSKPESPLANDKLDGAQQPTITCGDASGDAVPISASDWIPEYRYYYRAYHLQSEEDIVQLNDQAVSGNRLAAGYLMLLQCEKEPDRSQGIADALWFESIPVWLQSTDDALVAHAQFISGSCYYYGLGCEESGALSMAWHLRAAENQHAEAQFNVGERYYYGIGCQHSNEQAVLWLRKASDQGHAAAQILLATCYLLGYGLDEDHTQAVAWFRTAAEQGVADAQYMLGDSLFSGRGVQEDVREAAEWYRRAAEQDHIEAQYRLAVCYSYGRGVDVDKVTAITWYRKAAEQGHVGAQDTMGDCYRHGEGVAKNILEAITWYQRAAAQGYGLSISTLNNMNVELVSAS